jgi:hypothetical protein
MDIPAQVQALINEAPPDDVMQEGIQVVAEVLGQVASGLGHLQYYILQNFENQWQVTTLEHRTQPDLQKTVLYVYGHLADATRMGQSTDLIAVPVQTVPLLFQFFSFAQVDSLLFVDEANQPDQMKELSRADLQAVVQASLQDQIQPKDPYMDDFGTTIA